jgi:hypothetical protein
MKLFRLSTVGLILAFVLLKAEAAPITFYTYGVSESLVCTSVNCPNDSNIALQGTLTTDGLGSLTAKDVVVWDLTITLTGQAPIRLTQNNGQFSTFGSPQILATSRDLTITRNTTSDGFTLGGNTNAPASWLYGAPIEVLFYNTSAGDQYSAQRILSTPSTFTAAAVSSTVTPEPSSLNLGLIAAFFLFASWVGKGFRKSTNLGRLGFFPS